MQSFHLSNGRRLSWAQWGASSNRVVLFCTGAGMAGVLPFGQSEAEQLGLRIIAVDRPGLGGSDPNNDKNFANWASDIQELIKHLEADYVAALGFSQGAPFAFSLAAFGVAQAVTIVSGQDELAYASTLNQLAEPIAQMVRRVASEPANVEKEISSMANAEWLWSMIETMSSPQDRAFYASESFAALYRAALTSGFGQGASGYARDTILAMSPWPFRVEELTCPVSLWYGLRDTSPVHSPDFGRTLSTRIKTSKLSQIENEGSAILWTHASEILRESCK